MILILFCLFFEPARKRKHPIQGSKAKDLLDWVKVANIIKKGDHLTKEGSSEIIKIKSGMNKGRPIT